MNKTIQMLFDEHEIIVNAIDAAQQLKTQLGKSDKQYEQNVRDLIGFFRDYADNYHHHKEEQILFPAMKKKNELLADGVLKEMLDNHEEFRELINSVEKALDEKNYIQSQQKLDIYSEALLNHIAVENEEVFQMAETLLTEPEAEKMLFDFEDADIELGSGKKQEYEELIESLRGNLKYSD
jgi:hemerythrin-like domain-containing protein